MKFSHSLQLNASVEWQDYYIAYSNLKKWIYLIEKAKLGFIVLPVSYKSADPASINLRSPTPAQSTRQTDEETPLLEDCPSGLGIVHAPTPSEIEAFFREALDDQLEKIVNFYTSKEREVLAEVEGLVAETDACEAAFSDIARMTPTPSGRPRTLSGSVHFEEPTSTSALLPRNYSYPTYNSDSVSSAHTQTSAGPPSLFTLPEADTVRSGSPLHQRTPITPLPFYHRSESPHGDRHHLWTRPEHRHQKSRLITRATSAFVILSNLDDYRAMNRTGFAKILKKFEKVTGQRLKTAYMAERVDVALPFLNDAGYRLRSQCDRVVGVYARVAAEGSHAQAATELKSKLREHIVWERNTVWREMVENEHRTASLGVRRKSTIAGEEIGDGYSARCCGIKFLLPSFLTYKVVMFTLCCAGFYALLYEIPIFESIEQQNCLAILVFASALWAFEVLPLFVTSLIVPLAVICLGVMREAVKMEDGSIEWHRLGAKAAVKRVFADMFSPVIMLLLGGFSLAAALSKHAIAQGVASVVLGFAGSAPRNVLLANIFLSTFLSMWISNVAAPVLCFSLLDPILRNLNSRSPYGKALIMGIALAANVGGMASPIASPQNIVAIGILNDLMLTVTWPQWFMITLPVCIAIDIGIWLLLLMIYRPSMKEMEHSHRPTTPSTPLLRNASAPVLSMVPPEQANGANYFVDHPITGTQVYILVITLATIGLWCFESQIEAYVGDMGVIAILPIIAFYGTGILSKDDWNQQLWTVVTLAMGGICLGKAVDSSGLLANITTHMIPYLAELSSLMCLLLFSGIVLVITSFISHTVGALIILPAIAQIGLNLPDPQPRLFVMAITLICSGAMGLPVSSFPNMNAISVEHKTTRETWLTVADFMKVGLPASVVAWAAIVGVGYNVMVLIGFK